MKILARVQAGPDDPRYSENYLVEGQRGFFRFGAHAAVQWEQVTRMLQLRVLEMAQRSYGPVALHNTADGKPYKESTLHTRQQGQLL